MCVHTKRIIGPFQRKLLDHAVDVGALGEFDCFFCVGGMAAGPAVD